MIILLHSSKTMRDRPDTNAVMTTPQLVEQASELQDWLSAQSVPALMKLMKISSKLAHETQRKIDAWSTEPRKQTPAIDSFIGDIYSGLQATELSDKERSYAQKHLRILSGLYGILRPLDGVMPYRLEMGYKTFGFQQKNLYEFWSSTIAETLPPSGWIVNVSSDEYTKAVLPYIAQDRIITPRFLTLDQAANKPVFVVVHAKIARGAFARWLVKTENQDPESFTGFNDLGYTYNSAMSTYEQPVFICKTFKGLGLSVRLA